MNITIPQLSGPSSVFKKANIYIDPAYAVDMAAVSDVAIVKVVDTIPLDGSKFFIIVTKI